MGLAGAAWPKLHRVVVRNHERGHARDQHILLTLGQLFGLEPDAAEEQGTPLFESEAFAAADEGLKGVPCRHLDRSDRLDAEGLPTRLLTERSDVLERDLRIEPSGQHAV